MIKHPENKNTTLHSCKALLRFAHCQYVGNPEASDRLELAHVREGTAQAGADALEDSGPVAQTQRGILFNVRVIVAGRQTGSS